MGRCRGPAAPRMHASHACLAATAPRAPATANRLAGGGCLTGWPRPTGAVQHAPLPPFGPCPACSCVPVLPSPRPSCGGRGALRGQRALRAAHSGARGVQATCPTCRACRRRAACGRRRPAQQLPGLLEAPCPPLPRAVGGAIPRARRPKQASACGPRDAAWRSAGRARRAASVYGVDTRRRRRPLWARRRGPWGRVGAQECSIANPSAEPWRAGRGRSWAWRAAGRERRSPWGRALTPRVGCPRVNVSAAPARQRPSATRRRLRARARLLWATQMFAGGRAVAASGRGARNELPAASPQSPAA